MWTGGNGAIMAPHWLMELAFILGHTDDLLLDEPSSKQQKQPQHGAAAGRVDDVPPSQ